MTSLNPSELKQIERAVFSRYDGGFLAPDGNEASARLRRAQVARSDALRAVPVEEPEPDFTEGLFGIPMALWWGVPTGLALIAGVYFAWRVLA